MITFALIFGLTLAQAGSAKPAPAPAPAVVPKIAPKAVATAELKDAAGKTVGVATLFEGPGGLLMRLEAAGQTPGWHGVHFHEKGACAAPDFASAGAHIKAGAHTHGLLSPDGHEAGDLPNVFADQAGTVRAAIWSDSVSLKSDKRPALLDADGSAVVIHAGVDDQVTQPTGGSGARVACGVIKPAA